MTTVTDPVLHNRIPVQVSSEGNANAQPVISAEEANAIASREANSYFNPRSVAPPSSEYVERAQLSQPGTPPSLGAGYTHREDLAHLSQPPSPEYTVRMQGAQQRFQSLDSENEEAALAAPPDYANIGARNAGRFASNVPAHTGHRRIDSR